MWKDLNYPVVIAHRGDKVNAPENTLPAFIKAADVGTDAIELDVKLTKDGHVVVLHDQTVDRTTTSSGDISGILFSDAHRMTANRQFGNVFNDATIPSLEEVFEAVGKRLHINIELTNYTTPGDGLVEQVILLIKKHQVQDRILFSSFLPRNLKIASALFPQIPRALLASRGLKGLPARAYFWMEEYFALNAFSTDLHAGLINCVHRTGRYIFAWTIIDAREGIRMVELGVDGFIADDPGLMLKLLDRNKSDNLIGNIG